MRETDIIRALSVMKDNQDSFFMAHVKTGPTWFSHKLRIIDAVAIKRSWTSPCISFYEIKTNRADFLRDEKWVDYLQYCHKFYFACPVGVIKKEDLQSRVSLVYVTEQGKAYTKKKGLMSHVEMPTDLFYYIVMSKLEPDRDPFHESRLEKWRRFIEFAKEKREVGYEVRDCIGQMVVKLEQKIKTLEYELASTGEISRLLKEEGLNIYGLRDLIANRHKFLSPELDRALKTIARLVDRDFTREVFEK